MRTGARRTIRVLLAIGVVLLLALVAIPAVYWMRLPRYQGKTLVFWWNEYVECERMPRAMVASGTSSFTPGDFQTRYRRMTNALGAFRADDARVGEFLLGKLNPARLRGILFTNWGRLSPSWRSRLQAWEPLDPREQRWLAQSVFH